MPPLSRVERVPNLVTRVEQQLRAAIAAGKYAQGQLPTEIELADELGVSRETVRRATETLAAEGILVKYRRKGTFLKDRATSDAKPASRLVGFIQADYRLSDGSGEPTTRHIGRLLLDGALDAARQRDLDLVVQRASSAELARRAARLLASTSPAGLLFASLAEEKLLRRLAGRGVPMVLVDHDAPLAGVSTLRDDSVGGAHLAVEHLASWGHRHIAIAYWRATELNPWRLQGYRDALRALGLMRRRQWELLTDLGASGAREVVARWRELKPRPTAIYCFNNSLAVQILTALHEAGLRVPADVSLIGGGGEDHATLTYHQCDWHAMGKQALELLADSLASNTPAANEHRLLPHQLVPGTTVAVNTNPTR